MWWGNADLLLELAVGEWGNSSYDSIFSVKYEVRSSPQSSGGDLKRDKGMWRNADLLEKCGMIEGLEDSSVFMIISSETSRLTWAVECKH